MPDRRRRLRGLHQRPHADRHGAGRPHLRGARARTPPATQGTATRGFTTDTTAPTVTHHRRAERAHERHDAELHVHERSRARSCECRIDAGAFAVVHDRLHADGHGPGRAHVRGPRDRRRRQRRHRRQHADSRSTRPRRRRPSPAARTDRPTTRRRPSRSPSEAGASFQCRIDAAAFADCTSGHTPTVTAQGEHTLRGARHGRGRERERRGRARRSPRTRARPPRPTIHSPARRRARSRRPRSP